MFTALQILPCQVEGTDFGKRAAAACEIQHLRRLQARSHHLNVLQWKGAAHVRQWPGRTVPVARMGGSIVQRGRAPAFLRSDFPNKVRSMDAIFYRLDNTFRYLLFVFEEKYFYSVSLFNPITDNLRVADWRRPNKTKNRNKQQEQRFRKKAAVMQILSLANKATIECRVETRILAGAVVMHV